MKNWKQKLQAVVGKSDDLSDRLRLRLRSSSRSGVFVIIPYIGYETTERLVLNGRVLKDEGYAAPHREDRGWQNFVELYKRLESDEIPGARLRARFQGTAEEVVADGEGYFKFDIQLDRPLNGALWKTVDLELIVPPSPTGQPVHAAAQVLAPPATARFGVISDNLASVRSDKSQDERAPDIQAE